MPEPRFRDAQPIEQLAQLVAALLLTLVIVSLVALAARGFGGDPLPVFDRTNVVDEIPTRPPIYDNV